MTQYKARIASPGPAMRALDRLVFPEEKGPAWEQSLWWGVFYGPKLVAYAGLRDDGDHWTLSWCGVHPEHRRRGLQKYLIKLRLKHAREKDRKPVCTYTSQDNAGSQRALLAHGFRMTGTFTDGYGTFVRFKRAR